jgi:hypothetical protein
MEKRYPLAYLLETFCGLSSTNGNLNRWKALLRKSSVPIILDSGKWLIKLNDFDSFLKGREHCFRLEKEKTVHTSKSKERYNYPMGVTGSDNLQVLLTSKKQSLSHLKSIKKY